MIWRLVAYHDAALMLARYLASSARADRFRMPGPPSVLDCSVSLDWFRLGPQPQPDDVDPDAWLAAIEFDFVTCSFPHVSSGRFYTGLYGRSLRIEYRQELGPRIWRLSISPPSTSR